MTVAAPSERRLSLDGNDWQVLGLVPGFRRWHRIGAAEEIQAPSITGWIPATVPGHVVADVVAAGMAPDPYTALNSLAAEWIAQREWVYRRSFTVPAGFRRERVVLHFEGVDDACKVFLNGCELGSHEGMNRAFEFDVSEHLRDGENVVSVALEQAPFEPDIQAQLGNTRDVRTWKVRFTYWWDFSTRLVSTGIWDSVWLEARSEASLRDLWTRTERTGDGWQLEVLGNVDGNGGDLELAVELKDGDRVVAQSQTRVSTGPVRLAMPAPGVDVWNVNGCGEQRLYRAAVELRRRSGEVLHTAALPVGFRTIEFERTPGAGEDALPYRVVVNGRRIFIRGWNWVPVDQLYGVLRPERYRNLIDHAKAAGCNLLRVWGGGHLERELFYDLCDEAGILVWQEFIQSSSGEDSQPATDAEYLEYIAAQAEAMVTRRRMHPSLAIWCGGNELAVHPERTPLSTSHPAVGVLRDVVARLDPDRLFLPTSPSGPRFDLMKEGGVPGHDVHGPWHFTGDGEYHRFHDRSEPMLYSEFGAVGTSDLDALERYMPGAHWPPDWTNRTWVHHTGYWWIDIRDVEPLFGPLREPIEYVRAGQWVQAHALAYAIEAQRRREDHCAGVIPWQLNEPWPNGAQTNAVQYGGRAKPAYWAVARAYAPLLISAAFRGIRWEPGEEFTAAVWGSGAVPAGCTARWTITDVGDGSVRHEQAVTIEGGTGLAQRVGACTWTIPQEPTLWALDLHIEDGDGGVVASNQYLFSSFAEPPLAPLLRCRPGRLSAVRDASGDLHVSAEGAPIIGVRVYATDGRPGPGVGAGWIAALFPGRPVSVGQRPGREICVSAWNAPDIALAPRPEGD